MRFFLGTHRPNWLTLTDVPLFVSYRQLRARRSALQPSCEWALDSGGYTELTTYGRWTVTPDEYIDAVARYVEWGRLQWAAPQDWMCEDWVLDMTGKSVQEHQELTVQNYLDLRAPGLPFIPVLQGQHLDDYLRHVEMYTGAGISLPNLATVGVGSVCRRQGTKDATEIFTELASLGLQCHGFGVKTSGLRQYGDALQSADSMAWSIGARHDANKIRKHGGTWQCPYGDVHKACNNCIHYALAWRNKVVS